MTDGRETAFYEDDRGVRVTGTKVVVGAEAFAFKSVTSVRVRATRLQTYGRIASFVVGALFVLTAFWVGVAEDEANMAFQVLFVVGIAFVTAGIIWVAYWQRLYTIEVVSQSGTARVLKSGDKSYVQSVAKAIGEAMVGEVRGTQ